MSKTRRLESEKYANGYKEMAQVSNYRRYHNSLRWPRSLQRQASVGSSFLSKLIFSQGSVDRDGYLLSGRWGFEERPEPIITTRKGGMGWVIWKFNGSAKQTATIFSRREINSFLRRLKRMDGQQRNEIWMRNGTRTRSNSGWGERNRPTLFRTQEFSDPIPFDKNFSGLGEHTGARWSHRGTLIGQPIRIIYSFYSFNKQLLYASCVPALLQGLGHFCEQNPQKPISSWIYIPGGSFTPHLASSIWWGKATNMVCSLRQELPGKGSLRQLVQTLARKWDRGVSCLRVTHLLLASLLVEKPFHTLEKLYNSAAIH